MINVALIGLGRIGQMHAENLFFHKSFKLKYTFDINTKLNKKLSKKLSNKNGLTLLLDGLNTKCLIIKIILIQTFICLYWR